MASTNSGAKRPAFTTAATTADRSYRSFRAAKLLAPNSALRANSHNKSERRFQVREDVRLHSFARLDQPHQIALGAPANSARQIVSGARDRHRQTGTNRRVALQWIPGHKPAVSGQSTPASESPLRFAAFGGVASDDPMRNSSR